MRKRLLLWSLLALAAAASRSTEPPRFEIVVHPDSAVTSVSRTELSKIFLGRLRSWVTGDAAVPVDQVPESPVRGDFSELVHGRAVVTIEIYWKRMIFSGRGVPPTELENDREVLAFVRSRPGAVGYVSPSTPLVGVRRLVLVD